MSARGNALFLLCLTGAERDVYDEYGKRLKFDTRGDATGETI
jgi:hypothetical protein